MKIPLLSLVMFGIIVMSGCLSSGQPDLIQSSKSSVESDPIAMANISSNFANWSGAGSESDPVAMANISSNFAAWSLDTYGSGSANLTNNFTACNQANEATTWNGTYGNCISVVSSDDQTLAQVLTQGNIANMDINMGGYNVTNSPIIDNHIANTSNPHNFVESDPVAMTNISTNIVAWLDKYNVTYAGYQALITSLQGNDTWLFQNVTNQNNTNIAQNASISSLQRNDTSINSSILQLQENDTADRSYVNDTFLKLNTTIRINTTANYSDLNNNYGIRINVTGSGAEIRTRVKDRIAFFPSISAFPNTFVDIISVNIPGNIQHENLIYEFQSNQTIARFRGYKTKVLFETRYEPYSIAFAPGNNSEAAGFGLEVMNLTRDTVTFPRLLGSGNALTYVNSTGTLQRDEIGYTSGTGFMCYNSTALWFFSTTSCDTY